MFGYNFGTMGAHVGAALQNQPAVGGTVPAADGLISTSSPPAQYDPVAFAPHLDRLRGVLGSSTETFLKWFFGERQKHLEKPFTEYGPGVNFQDFCKTIVVPLVKLSTGGVPNARQLCNYGACRLLSKTITPKHIVPMDNVLFRLSLRKEQLKLAQASSFRHVGGCTSVDSVTLEFPLVTKSQGFTIQSSEVFFATDQSEVRQLLHHRFQQLEHGWTLTIAKEHFDYCAKQPTLSELATYQAHRNRVFAGRVHLNILQAENIIMGCVNRQPKQLSALIQCAVAALPGESKDYVLVLPKKMYMEGNIGESVFVCEVPVDNAIYEYTVEGRDSANVITDVSWSKPLVSRTAMTKPQPASGAKSYTADGTNELAVSLSSPSAAEDQGPLQLPCFQIGGASVPVIVLDDRRFYNDGPSMQDSFVTTGNKLLFFTVGSCPVLYKTLSPTVVFGKTTKCELVDAGKLSLYSPSSTYYMNHGEGNAVAEITLRALHRYGNHPEMFDATRTTKRVCMMYPRDQLDSAFSEQRAADLFRESEWSGKCRHSQSLLEFSPRTAPIKQWQDEAYVISFVPRLCLWNGTPLSMWYNELYGVGADMVARIPLSPDFEDYLAFVQACARDTNVNHFKDAAILKYWAEKVNENISDRQRMMQPMGDLLRNANSNDGIHLGFSDPLIQLLFIRYYEHEFDKANDPQHTLEKVFVLLRCGLKTILQTHEHLFTSLGCTGGLHHSLAQILEIHQLFVNPVPRAATEGLTETQSLFIKYYTLCVTPWITNRVLHFKPYRVDEAQSLVQTGLKGLGIYKDVWQQQNTETFLYDKDGNNTAFLVADDDPPHTICIWANETVSEDLNSSLVAVEMDRGFLRQEETDDIDEDEGVVLIVCDTTEINPVFARNLDEAQDHYNSNGLPNPVERGIHRGGWNARVKMLRAHLTNHGVVAFLLSIHYCTLMDYTTVINLYDRLYYSGMAYVCVRQMRYRGYGFSVMPMGESLFVTGNRYTHTPINNEHQMAIKQSLDMAVAPGRIGAYGVFVPDVFLDLVDGLGAFFYDAETIESELANAPLGSDKLMKELESAVAVLDSFNGFTPEGFTSSGNCPNVIPVNGRYFMTHGRDHGGQTGYFSKDPYSNNYSENPALIADVSDSFYHLRKVLLPTVSSVTSNSIYHAVLKAAGCDNLSPYFVHAPLTNDRDTDRIVHEIVDRNMNNNAKHTVFNNGSGVMVTDNYTIGRNSESKLRQRPARSGHIEDSLSPRILGEGAFPGTFFDPETEYAFMQKYQKYTGLQVSMSTKNINGLANQRDVAQLGF